MNIRYIKKINDHPQTPYIPQYLILGKYMVNLIAK